MPINAGRLNSKVYLLREMPSEDGWGGNSRHWVEVGEPFRVNIKSATGMQAARAGLSTGIPFSFAQYSVMARTKSVESRGISSSDRLRVMRDARTIVLRIRGVIPDLSDKTITYLVCEVEEHDAG